MRHSKILQINVSLCNSPIFAICTLYLMGNYAIEPVEPLDLTLLSINL